MKSYVDLCKSAGCVESNTVARCGNGTGREAHGTQNMSTLCRQTAMLFVLRRVVRTVSTGQ
jgi:hypothetical protein